MPGGGDVVGQSLEERPQASLEREMTFPRSVVSLVTLSSVSLVPLGPLCLPAAFFLSVVGNLDCQSIPGEHC